MEFDYFDIVLLGFILPNRLHILMQSRNFILNMTLLQGTQYVRGSYGICYREPVNTQERASIFSTTSFPPIRTQILACLIYGRRQRWNGLLKIVRGKW